MAYHHECCDAFVTVIGLGFYHYLYLAVFFILSFFVLPHCCSTLFQIIAFV